MPNFLLVVSAAALFVAVIFGGRSALALTIQGIDQSVFLNYLQISFAFALGQLVIGIVAPFSGMLADEYGTGKTLMLGVVMTISGNLLIPVSSNPMALYISLGVISSIGIGIAGLPVVLASVNRLVKPQLTGMAFGLVNAGQSLGQLVIAPIAGFFVLKFGWVSCIYFLCLIFLMIMPCSIILRSRVEKNKNPEEEDIGLRGTLSIACKTPSYIYLVSGFFVCGFHVAFIATHMPGVIAVCGLSSFVSGWSLGLIGFFNIVGSIFAGWYISYKSMRYFLFYIYMSRSVIVLLFLLSPKDLISILFFSAALGFTFFSVIPATAGLIGKMFGARFMATLFGFALFSHQIGGFLGAYFGGYFFMLTGDYTVFWLLDAGLAIFAAFVHLPIKESSVFQDLKIT